MIFQNQKLPVALHMEPRSRYMLLVLNEKISAFRKFIIQHAYLVAILLIIFNYSSRAIRYLKNPFYSPDVQNFYLPYAKKLIDTGPSFFLEKNSLIISPGSYLFHTFLGGNLDLIRLGGFIIGIILIFLLIGIGRNLGSLKSGFLAATLYSFSPSLIFWIPTALSEPFFLLNFFTFLYLFTKQSINSFLYASIPLSLSIFIRPVWLYPSFFLILFLLIAYIVTKNIVFKKSLLTFSLALLLPLIFIVRNKIVFNLPAISSGSGTTLFQGTNPYTGGFEPPTLGLSYKLGFKDPNEISKSSDFIEYNSKLSRVAKNFILDRSPDELFSFLAYKTSWNIFLTPLDSSFKGAIYRSILFSFSLFFILVNFKNLNSTTATLALMLLLQIGQSSLALYNSRYSAANIEPLFIVITSLGISFFIQKTFDSKQISLFLKHLSVVVVFFSIGIFSHFYFFPKPLIPKNIKIKTLNVGIFDFNKNSLILKKIPTPIKSRHSTLLIFEFFEKIKTGKCMELTVVGSNQLSANHNRETKIILAPGEYRTFASLVDTNLDSHDFSQQELEIKSCNSDILRQVKSIKIVETNVDRYWN